MSYQRVIPRDLFNEGNLLKCVGKLWIETERFREDVIRFEHDGEPFDIGQDEDGSIRLNNVTVYVHNEPHGFYRPLNSHQPWPLYMETDGDTIAVFTDEEDHGGELSREFMEYLAKEVVCTGTDTE